MFHHFVPSHNFRFTSKVLRLLLLLLLIYVVVVVVVGSQYYKTFFEEIVWYGSKAL